MSESEELTPEEFEEEKFVSYFPKLQTAYKRAFNVMNEEYDSTLVHAIDQQVLSESEPHYEGDGEFIVELPPDPLDRLTGVVVPDEKAETVLEEHVAQIRRELRHVFGFEEEAE